MTDNKTTYTVSNQYFALQKACEEKGFKLANHQGFFWIIDGFNKYYTKGTFEQVSSWLEDVESPFDSESFPIIEDEIFEDEDYSSLKFFLLFSVLIAIMIFAVALFSNNLKFGFFGLPFLAFAWWGFFKKPF